MAVRNFRYKVTVKGDNIQEIADWCKQNVGRYGITWGRINGTWRFRFKQEAVLFTLRWV